MIIEFYLNILLYFPVVSSSPYPLPYNLRYNPSFLNLFCSTFTIFYLEFKQSVVNYSKHPRQAKWNTYQKTVREDEGFESTGITDKTNLGSKSNGCPDKKYR